MQASKVVLTATDACRQTQSVLSDVFCSTDFVDPKTLMTCLVDENDEAALKSRVERVFEFCDSAPVQNDCAAPT